MAISIFEVAGPIMIGPSSSHTAGAVRLGRMSALLAEGSFTRADFHLYGSFAKTYRGHGTDLALVAGVLGMEESDERLSRSFEIARERGIGFSFFPEEKRTEYDNQVTIVFHMTDGRERTISGCSLGGGRIRILEIDGFETKLGCERPTAVVMHRDVKGVLSHITGVFADNGLNIAVMRCGRAEKGSSAVSVLQADQPIPPEVKGQLERVDGVLSVTVFDPEGGVHD